MFPHFFNFIHLKVWQKKIPEKSLVGQISIFWAKNYIIFKNKKLYKKVRKHSLDTCISTLSSTMGGTILKSCVNLLEIFTKN